MMELLKSGMIVLAQFLYASAPDKDKAKMDKPPAPAKKSKDGPALK